MSSHWPWSKVVEERSASGVWAVVPLEVRMRIAASVDSRPPRRCPATWAVFIQSFSTQGWSSEVHAPSAFISQA
jgi:hypothetical protein